MDNLSGSGVQAVTAADLTPVVRLALGRPALRLLGWQSTPLGGNAGNPVSLGIHRFSGEADDDGQQASWSVILKRIQSPANLGWTNMGEGDDQTHWNYWKREALLYPSGLLDSLPDGLAAPRCYGIVEQPGEVIWLWLEDIHASDDTPWPLERYAQTARHLGRLNGRFLHRAPNLTQPWLSRRRSHAWLNLAGEPLPWEHPWALERYPAPEHNAFKHLLEDAPRILAQLDRLPVSFGHGDTYPTNFISRRVTNGAPQTVALDWALAGVEPLGDDLGQLVFGAQNHLPELALSEIEAALFVSYLDGLRDEGCTPAARWLRFGYLVTAAIRVGGFQSYLISSRLKSATAGGPASAAAPATTDPFEVTMARAALALLD